MWARRTDALPMHAHITSMREAAEGEDQNGHLECVDKRVNIEEVQEGR